MATGFATAFRKRTTGFVITEISQLNRDRIIRIAAEKGDSSINIIFELFGKGNMVVTDGSMKILLAYRRQEFRDRTVASGREYVPPKSGTVDFTSGDAYDIGYEESEENVAKYLSSRLGIGKMYVEEALIRNGADPTSTIASMKDRLHGIESSVKGLIDEALGTGGARVYKENGMPVDFALVELTKYSGSESVECSSLNEALDIVYSSAAEQAAERETAEEDSPEIRSTIASIEKQRKSIEGLVAESERNKYLGTVIFNNMEAINGLIRAAAQDRHATAESLQKAAAAQGGIKVLSVDLKSKKGLLEIEGEEGAADNNQQ